MSKAMKSSVSNLLSISVCGVALAIALATSARAQELTWKDLQGKPIPETEARRSKNGLGGSLLVTSDADWQEKWNTPAETIPEFKEAKSVGRGQRIFVLIFFANPRLDADGRANLSCDLDVTRPDGSVSTHQAGVACFQEKLLGGPYQTYVAAPVIGFVGDAADPAGTWTVQVSLKDNLSDTVLPLKTSFVLK